MNNLKQKQLNTSMDYPFTLHREGNKLDILCLGEASCNFSKFLTSYTKQEKDDSQAYNIYLKKTEKSVVFLHELDEDDQLYYTNDYHAIIFFIDLFHHLNTLDNILKCLDKYSQCNGVNIFKIPIIVIALNCGRFNPGEYMEEKRKLEKQLNSILKPNQLLYYLKSDLQEESRFILQLQKFYEQLKESQCQGIKSSNLVIYKLYGVGELAKPYIRGVQKLFFRVSELLNVSRNLISGYVSQEKPTKQ